MDLCSIEHNFLGNYLFLLSNDCLFYGEFYQKLHTAYLNNEYLTTIFLTSIYRDLADNKVFFQHPDLMRALGIHETVMQLMINTLNKAQHQSKSAATETPGPSSQRRRGSIISLTNEEGAASSKVNHSIFNSYIICC